MAHTPELAPFTPAEQARLAVYKVAVAAGLYTETIQDQTYRFAAEELARLGCTKRQSPRVSTQIS